MRTVYEKRGKFKAENVCTVSLKNTKFVFSVVNYGDCSKLFVDVCMHSVRSILTHGIVCITKCIRGPYMYCINVRVQTV